MVAPHSDQAGAKRNVIQPGYNEANLLERVDAWLQRAAEPAGLLDPQTADHPFVTDIDYDAKGQRTRIDYGNGAGTTYDYDPLTFRLTHLQTTPPSPSERPGRPQICQERRQPLQDLHYTYDPAGNITHIGDEAQQTIYSRPTSASSPRPTTPTTPSTA